jgi:hypothetical protein
MRCARRFRTTKPTKARLGDAVQVLRLITSVCEEAG